MYYPRFYLVCVLRKCFLWTYQVLLKPRKCSPLKDGDQGFFNCAPKEAPFFLRACSGKLRNLLHRLFLNQLMFVIQRKTIPELSSKSSVDKEHMRGPSSRTVAMEEWAQEGTQKGVWPSLSFCCRHSPYTFSIS